MFFNLIIALLVFFSSQQVLLAMDINGELKNARFEKSATDPILNVLEGRVYYNTADDVAKWYTGAAWKIAADTDSAQIFTNKTLTAPKLNENVAVTTTATQLNYLGSATGTTGTTSTNVVFSTSPSLTTPTITSPSIATSATYANQAEVRYAEQTGNGTNYIGFKAPDAVTANKVFKLPDGDGSSGQVLSTDGSLNLSWASAATVPSSGAVYSTGAALASEAQLALTRGGSNKSITATAGGVLWTDSDSFEVTSAGTVGKVLASTGTTAPTWVPGQTDTNRITASYNVTDTDGYRTIIATTQPSNVTFSSRSTSTITFTGTHGMERGTPIVFNGAGTPPTGLTSGVTYYAIPTSTTATQFAATISDAINGLQITLSGDGSGIRTWAVGIAVTLPTASDNTDRLITVKKSYSGAPGVAIVPEGSSETIDGSVGVVLDSQHAARTVVAENSLWYMVGRAIPNVKYQKKILATSKTSTTTVTDLGFSNLIIGRTYRVTMQGYFRITGSSATETQSLRAVHNGADIARVSQRADAAPDTTEQAAGTSVVFIAEATTVTFEFGQTGTGSLLGDDGSGKNTWSQIEELPSHEVTTGF